MLLSHSSFIPIWNSLEQFKLEQQANKDSLLTVATDIPTDPGEVLQFIEKFYFAATDMDNLIEAHSNRSDAVFEYTDKRFQETGWIVWEAACLVHRREIQNPPGTTETYPLFVIRWDNICAGVSGFKTIVKQLAERDMAYIDRFVSKPLQETKVNHSRVLHISRLLRSTTHLLID